MCNHRQPQGTRHVARMWQHKLRSRALYWLRVCSNSLIWQQKWTDVSAEAPVQTCPLTGQQPLSNQQHVYRSTPNTAQTVEALCYIWPRSSVLTYVWLLTMSWIHLPSQGIRVYVLKVLRVSRWSGVREVISHWLCQLFKEIVLFSLKRPCYLFMFSGIFLIPITTHTPPTSSWARYFNGRPKPLLGSVTTAAALCIIIRWLSNKWSIFGCVEQQWFHAGFRGLFSSCCCLCTF